MTNFKSIASSVLLAVASAASIAALASNPIDWDKRLDKANHELSIGEVDRAIKIYADEVKKHPEAGLPHVGLGRALKKKGRLADAKSEFRRATEVDPGCAQAYYELGAMQENDAEWKAAAASFEQYLQMAPDADNARAAGERLRNCKEKME